VKKGEKLGIWMIVGLMCFFFGLTVYLEVNRSDSAASGGASKSKAFYFPDIDPGQLPEVGTPVVEKYKLYCGQCHALPLPAMHARRDWSAIVARMMTHSRDQAGGFVVRILVPKDEEKRDLVAYLQRNGQKAADLALLEEPNSLSVRAFTGLCGRCHAVPDPLQHSASEWPRIVLRMKDNMRMAGQMEPDADTLQVVTAFLQERGANVPPSGNVTD